MGLAVALFVPLGEPKKVGPSLEELFELVPAEVRERLFERLDAHVATALAAGARAGSPEELALRLALARLLADVGRDISFILPHVARMSPESFVSAFSSFEATLPAERRVYLRLVEFATRSLLVAHQRLQLDAGEMTAAEHLKLVEVMRLLLAREDAVLDQEATLVLRFLTSLYVALSLLRDGPPEQLATWAMRASSEGAVVEGFVTARPPRGERAAAAPYTVVDELLEKPDELVALVSSSPNVELAQGEIAEARGEGQSQVGVRRQNVISRTNESRRRDFCVTTSRRGCTDVVTRALQTTSQG